MNNSDNVVLITGVTKGLGRALLEVFYRNKWTIVGCGRSKVLIEQLAQEFHLNQNLRILDISNHEEVKRWATAVITTFGKPSIMINNASAVNFPANLWDISHKEFKQVIDTNLMGVFNILSAFLPYIIDSKSTIVNVSSYWGKHGEAKVSPYCASKFAIEGLTQSLAKEVSENNIIVTLDPGIMRTDMLKKCASDQILALAKSPYEKAVNIYSKLTELVAADSGKTILID